MKHLNKFYLIIIILDTVAKKKTPKQPNKKNPR